MVLTLTLIRVKCISIKVVACIFSIDVYLQTQSYSNLIKVFIVKRLWNTQLLKSKTFEAKHPPPSQLTSPRNVATASKWPNHMNPLQMSRNCNLSPLLRPSLSLTRHLYDKTIGIKVVWNYFLHLITCIFHKHNHD